MPGAPSSFLLLVAMPGAPSSLSCPKVGWSDTFALAGQVLVSAVTTLYFARSGMCKVRDLEEGSKHFDSLTWNWEQKRYLDSSRKVWSTFVSQSVIPIGLLGMNSETAVSRLLGPPTC